MQTDTAHNLRSSEAEFHAYLDQLWQEYGKCSAVKRGEIAGEDSPASQEEIERVFAGLGWKPLQNAIVYSGPIESDGGGAIYYFDHDAGIAYQRTRYW